MVETHKFNSSLIAYAAYDTVSRLSTVTLVGSGKTYGYENVSPITWGEFKASKSAGSYYNNYLRKFHTSLGECEPLEVPVDDVFFSMSDFDETVEMIEGEEREARKEVDFFYALPEVTLDFFEAAADILKEEVVSGSSYPTYALTKASEYIPEERIKELQTQAKIYADNVNAVSINSPVSLVLAEDLFKSGKELYKVLSEEISPITEAHYRSYKEAKSNENSILGPIEEATEHISKAIYAYRKELERLQAFEQQRVLEEARKASVDSSVPVFAPLIEILPPKKKGTTTKKKMVAVVDSLEELILAVAEGIKAKKDGKPDGGFPAVGCLEVVQSVLNASAKGREEGQLYPGVRIEDQGGMVKTRGKKV